MKKITLSMLTALTLASLSTFALAKGGTPQNHHCMKDGAELAGKTKKDCKKDGGTWAKDTAAAKPEADKAAPAPAPAPAK